MIKPENYGKIPEIYRKNLLKMLKSRLIHTGTNGILRYSIEFCLFVRALEVYDSIVDSFDTL